MFCSKGTWPTSMHIGLPVQGLLIGVLSRCTKVLQALTSFCEPDLRQNLQNRVSYEQHQYSQRDKSQSSHIDQSTFGPDITFVSIFVVGIRIMKVIVLLHVFWEKQQAS